MRLFIIVVGFLFCLSGPVVAKDLLPTKPSKMDILDRKLDETAAMDKAKWAGSKNSRSASSNRKTYVNDPAYTRSDRPETCRRADSTQQQGCH